ncbi:hypothetical protein C8R44DRAFT_761399, partial [Mycena epipterygia]
YPHICPVLALCLSVTLVGQGNLNRSFGSTREIECTQFNARADGKQPDGFGDLQTGEGLRGLRRRTLRGLLHRIAVKSPNW